MRILYTLGVALLLSDGVFGVPTDRLNLEKDRKCTQLDKLSKKKGLSQQESQNACVDVESRPKLLGDGVSKETCFYCAGNSIMAKCRQKDNWSCSDGTTETTVVTTVVSPTKGKISIQSTRDGEVGKTKACSSKRNMYSITEDFTVLYMEPKLFLCLYKHIHVGAFGNKGEDYVLDYKTAKVTGKMETWARVIKIPNDMTKITSYNLPAGAITAVGDYEHYIKASIVSPQHASVHWLIPSKGNYNPTGKPPIGMITVAMFAANFDARKQIERTKIIEMIKQLKEKGITAEDMTYHHAIAFPDLSPVAMSERVCQEPEINAIILEGMTDQTYGGKTTLDAEAKKKKLEKLCYSYFIVPATEYYRSLVIKKGVDIVEKGDIDDAVDDGEEAAVESESAHTLNTHTERERESER